MKSDKVSGFGYGVLLLLLVTLANGQRVVPGVNPQHYQQGQQQHYQQQHPQHQQQQYQPPVHVAPGVAPQQYQQGPGQVQYQQQQVPVQQQQQQQIPQQQQQVPQHQQQVPQHQQQVPQQQQQVPQQQQQVPQQQVPQQQQQQHHQQGHHQPHGQPQQVLNTGNIDHERAHIQEHMQVPIDTSKMSEAELQFHYFKMHDSDNNNKLDGCELIKSLIHWHVDDHNKPKPGEDAEHDGGQEKTGHIYTDKGLADVIDYVLNTMDLDKDGYVDYIEYRKGEDEAGKGTNA